MVGFGLVTVWRGRIVGGSMAEVEEDVDDVDGAFVRDLVGRGRVAMLNGHRRKFKLKRV